MTKEETLGMYAKPNECGWLPDWQMYRDSKKVSKKFL